jgi:hypothetical protein
MVCPGSKGSMFGWHLEIIMTNPRKPRFNPELIPSPCFILDEEYLAENLELMQYIRQRLASGYFWP